MKTFSISESLKFGREKIKANSRIVFGPVVFLAVLQILVRFSAPGHPSAWSTLAIIASAILQIIIGAGFTIIVLKLSRGEHAELREMIPPGRMLWQYVGSSILVGLMVMVPVVIFLILGATGYSIYMLKTRDALFYLILFGMLLCAAVAIWIALRYFFIKFLSIDGVRPIREILSESAKLSAGIKWQLVLFLLVIALINIVGAITLIGLLLSIPITLFATAHVYLKMLEVAPMSAAPTPAPAIE